MWVIIILTVVIVVLTHWLLTSPFKYWKKRGVPTPKPTIIVGNLGAQVILKKNLGQLYKEIYDEYKDYPYVGYYKFRKPGIILRDIELVKDVLIKEFSSFHDNDFHVNEDLDPLFARNPFTLTGDKWKSIRGLVTSSITHSKIKSMFNLINDVGDKMISYLDGLPEATNDVGVEAKELAAKFTTDCVASCAFGLNVKSFEDPNSEFREMGRKFLTPSFWTGIQHMFMFIAPEIGSLLKVRLITPEVHEWFCGVLTETIKYREANQIVRNDYLDLLISLKSKSSKYAFEDLDIIAQALTFYADGFETSSIAICFTLYELAVNPDIQKKVQEEIDTTLAKYNGELNYDTVLEMSYLDKIFSEALRMHGPVLFMARLCTKPFELPPPKRDGPNIKIEVGTPMIIPVLAIHNDPVYYPNPEKFDPERFSEENKESRPKCTFLAFGEGPRICLGNRFAVAQSKAALIKILSKYDVKINKKTIEPLEMNPQFFMNCAKGGVWLNFHKRQSTL